MKHRKFASLALGLSLLAASTANAAFVDAVDQGNYGEDGYHCTPCTNYFIGEVTGSDSNNGGALRFFQLRGFFIFDLSGITEPIGAASLLLPNLPNGPSMGFMSPQGTETLSIFSVESSIDSIRGFPGEIEVPVGRGLLNFEDLGSGIDYGSYQATYADGGTNVAISLNGNALAAINLAIQNSSLLAFGAALTSYDDNGIGPDSQAEGIFGQSGFMLAQLEVTPATAVPEPSTMWLLLAAAGMLFVVRRREVPRQESRA
jgi:hypothetical protein